MTLAQKMHRKSGQSLHLCEAYAKAGLTVSQVSPQYRVDMIGVTREEDQALEKFYRTQLEPMPECSPGCWLCHPNLPAHLRD